METSIIMWAQSTNFSTVHQTSVWHLMDNNQKTAYCNMRTRVKIETLRNDLPDGATQCQACLNYVIARRDQKRADALGQGARTEELEK